MMVINLYGAVLRMVCSLLHNTEASIDQECQRFSAVMRAHNNMVIGLKLVGPMGNVAQIRIVIPPTPRIVLSMGIRERRTCLCPHCRDADPDLVVIQDRGARSECFSLLA